MELCGEALSGGALGVCFGGIVAIDPAARAAETANETGIIVAGKDGEGRGWVLADVSGRYPPVEWAKAAIAAYRAHRADRIVAEVNNGGDMVEATLRMVDPNVPFRAVHASRGKVARAEPVATLYEQGKVRHLGALPLLETRCARLCAMPVSVLRRVSTAPRQALRRIGWTRWSGR